MFTAASLLAMATDAEARHQQLRALHPPGTICVERNEAADLAQRALVCAEWMEKRGVKSLAFVGPFGELPFQRGSLVRIRRGARIHSNHPLVPREGKLYQGTRPVKVHNVFKGYVTTHRSVGKDEVIQPEVHWAGTGGYWYWADANDVELVAAPPGVAHRTAL